MVLSIELRLFDAISYWFIKHAVMNVQSVMLCTNRFRDL